MPETPTAGDIGDGMVDASPAEAPAPPQKRGVLGVGGSTAKPRDIQKIGRNDPCFCGSGKKYKKCHGAGTPA
jgi:hypothetical protein